jgi:hypothetical protein
MIRMEKQGHHLPHGLNPTGLRAWKKMSHRQHQAANDLCAKETSYRARFCRQFNHAKMDPNWIEDHGYLKGLSGEGRKVWEMIEPEAQLEIFQYIPDGTTDRVRQFINQAWIQFKAGSLTEVQIVHGIMTLAAEEEEVREIHKRAR